MDGVYSLGIAFITRVLRGPQESAERTWPRAGLEVAVFRSGSWGLVQKDLCRERSPIWRSHSTMSQMIVECGGLESVSQLAVCRGQQASSLPHGYHSKPPLRGHRPSSDSLDASARIPETPLGSSRPWVGVSCLVLLTCFLIFQPWCDDLPSSLFTLFSCFLVSGGCVCVGECDSWCQVGVYMCVWVTQARVTEEEPPLRKRTEKLGLLVRQGSTHKGGATSGQVILGSVKEQVESWAW